MRNIDNYRDYLIACEKAPATISKYLHDVKVFVQFAEGKEIDKKLVLDFKEMLKSSLAPASVNSVISSVNSYLNFIGCNNCRIKTIKIQKQIFTKTDRELTRREYNRLLTAAQKNGDERLYYLMQTICSTGIRVSELSYITVESLRERRAVIQLKGKTRTVFLTRDLCKILKYYTKAHKIKSGSIFVTRTGKPLDRSNIWSAMKKLCKEAGVLATKVFPHNLRHLFARTYYSIQKDIVRLADILGHSSINTTRIYTMETGEIHRRQLEKLKLLRC